MPKDITQSPYAPLLLEDGKTITINGVVVEYARDEKSLLHKIGVPSKQMRLEIKAIATSKDEYHKLLRSAVWKELGMPSHILFSWYAKLWYRVHGAPLGLKGYMKRSKKRKNLVTRVDRDVSTKGMRGFL